MFRSFFILLICFIFLDAKTNVVVSINPEVAFVKAIGKDKVNVSLMVKPGNSPHTYEPKPSQMRDISKANLYFSIGVEFEDAWLDRFKSQNKNMKIIYIGDGIKKINMSSHHHNEHKIHTHHNRLDPHIWTTPNNIKIIATNIYKALLKFDSKNKIFYKKNYQSFIQELNNLDKKIKNILKNVDNNAKFMVFHPSWGYFAKEYNLEQFPIEIEGKTPKPKDILYIIKEAKEENIKAIIAQPEFSDKLAKQIAKELGIKVVKISPLSKDFENNLIKLSKAIANKS